MNDQEKRKAIGKYFQPAPNSSPLLIIGSVIFFFSSYFIYQKLAQARVLNIENIDMELAFMAIGLLFFVGGLANIFFYKKGQPLDQDVDKWLQEDYSNLEKRSIEKLNIDVSKLIAESVKITGPRLWDTKGALCRSRRGRDNILRFTPIYVTIINFGQDQLLIYSCILDFLTGKQINESTDEYFYNDIVAVATRSESKTVTTNNYGTLQLNHAETFTLTTTAGTSLSFILDDPTLIQKMGGGNFIKTDVEKTIQTIRNILRQKKT